MLYLFSYSNHQVYVVSFVYLVFPLLHAVISVLSVIYFYLFMS